MKTEAISIDDDDDEEETVEENKSFVQKLKEENKVSETFFIENINLLFLQHT